ncbi:class I SAM-dependent methyltransferase [Halobacteriovorax sp. GB3]|uniref:class I SAM-dependent methyltransferase n=1 Tax=Halobacteriovorax sp. GB3 TaxID=2719615 RepID=UPI00235E6BEE|nr:class I SAM-dependent methyltransferase [Halobacteriovorax sp. GB3]MDD0853365.1 class I SAM-dependent methyltransferase [Halobacteriovorax sp. GB3]
MYFKHFTVISNVLLAFIFLFGPTNSYSQECYDQYKQFSSKRSVQKLNYQEDQSGSYLWVNDILVTGEEVLYKTEDIIDSLMIEPYHLIKWRANGTRTLSLGEGFSGLVPFLLSQGIEVKGLDLWYHAMDDLPANNNTVRLMREYTRNYGKHLIQGSATDIPIEDNSIDIIMAHQLLNNLDERTSREVINEAIRVIRPIEGHIRLVGLKQHSIDYLQRLQTQGRIDVKFKSVSTNHYRLDGLKVLKNVYVEIKKR